MILRQAKGHLNELALIPFILATFGAGICFPQEKPIETKFEYSIPEKRMISTASM
jgi:hypothetical protein